MRTDIKTIDEHDPNGDKHDPNKDKHNKVSGLLNKELEPDAREMMINKHLIGLLTLNQYGYFNINKKLSKLLAKIISSESASKWLDTLGRKVLDECKKQKCELSENYVDCDLYSITPKQAKIIKDVLYSSNVEIRQITSAEIINENSEYKAPINSTAKNILLLKHEGKNDLAKQIQDNWDEVRNEVGFGPLKF